MTSWRSLPFELKAQILDHYIDLSMPEWPLVFCKDDRVRLCTQFATKLRSFLYNAPEMENKVVDKVSHAIKSRLHAVAELGVKVEAIELAKERFWAFEWFNERNMQQTVLRQVECLKLVLEGLRIWRGRNNVVMKEAELMDFFEQLGRKWWRERRDA